MRDRTEAAQAEMAQLTGSCEDAFATVPGEAGAEALAGARVGDARVDGQRAEVDVRHPERDEPITLAAVEDGGEWRLSDEG